MAVYTDSGMTKPVTEIERVYIGSYLYTVITWGVKTLENKVHFYINNCRVDQDRV